MSTPATPQQNNVGEFAEIQKLIDKLTAATLPVDLKERALAMTYRLQQMVKYGSFSREYEPIEKYVSWITQIPWGVFSQDDLTIEHAKKVLDESHFGLQPIKERIYEYLSMIKLQQDNAVKLNTQPVTPVQTSVPQVSELQSAVAAQPVTSPAPVTTANEMSRLQGSSSHAPILCFVGVQGIGKTSIAKSIANALGKNFIRISLGGIGGVAELRGRSRGEIDAEPGQVIKAIIRAGVMNPLILMDEVDKVSGETGLRADVMAALLEILDPEQNSTFLDHYIDYPVDLSKVMFICTANNLGGISAALLDRLEVIRMISYSDEEKANIAKNYLLPKVMAASGLLPDQIKFHDDVWPLVIRPLGFDAGIRQLERNITTMVRKVAKKIVTGEGTSFEVTPENFREYIPMDIGIFS